MSFKVTVLLTTYNHEPFIAQAIESVLMQETSFDYRLVVIEDDSTDETRHIVEQYRQKYPQKISLRLAPTNRNDNLFFSEEVQASDASYIATLDGDDYWTARDKLQKQVDFLDNHLQHTICFHNVMVHYEDNRLAPHPLIQSNGDATYVMADIWTYNIIPGCTPMLRRSAVPTLPSWFVDVHWADWALYLLYSEQGKIGYLNTCMGVYRKHAAGLWSGLEPLRQYESMVHFYREMNQNFQYKYNKIVRSRLASCYYKLAYNYEQNGHHAAARRWLVQALLALRHQRPRRRMTLLKLALRLLTKRPGQLKDDGLEREWKSVL